MIETIRHQFRNNFVAIVSLLVAVIALGYTTWREESTEKHRTIRQAGFEILKNLGQLQVVVNHSFYQKDSTLAMPFLGWGYTAFITDMSQLLSPSITQAADKLVTVWKGDWDKIKSDEEAVTRISNEIDRTRDAVLEEIRNLR